MAIDFPLSPTEGQVHNQSPGVSFVYRSGAWAAAPMKTALPRNYFINGGMTVSQQNGTTVLIQGSGGIAGTSASYYPADQWVGSWVYSDANATSRTVQCGSTNNPGNTNPYTITIGTAFFTP